MNAVSGQDILVTGGTGFIGSHLVRKLIEDGANVFVLVRNSECLGRIEPFRSRLNIIQADLGRLMPSQIPFLKPVYVFHLAAHGVENPLKDAAEIILANVLGTHNLLDFLIKEGRENLRGIVYAGTDFEYGGDANLISEAHLLNPTNYYSASKAAGWMFCKAYTAMYGLPITGVRSFYTYGPDQGERRFVSLVIKNALAGVSEFEMTAGEQERDFIFVSDVVNGMIKAAVTENAIGDVINLGTGIGTRLRSVVEKIISITGSSMHPKFGALPYRRGEIFRLVADNSLAKHKLGWAPLISLEEGLIIVTDWYKNHLTIM